jgi:hypothetical protein
MAAAATSAHTGQTGHHHQSDRCLRCAQEQHTPVRPVTATGHTGAQQSPEKARNHLKTF